MKLLGPGRPKSLNKLHAGPTCSLYSAWAREAHSVASGPKQILHRHMGTSGHTWAKDGPKATLSG